MLAVAMLAIGAGTSQAHTSGYCGHGVTTGVFWFSAYIGYHNQLVGQRNGMSVYAHVHEYQHWGRSSVFGLYTRRHIRELTCRTFVQFPLTDPGGPPGDDSGNFNPIPAWVEDGPPDGLPGSG
jgi:hypothetical protein